MKKRILFLTMAFVMTLAAFSVPNPARALTSGDYEYTLMGGTVSIDKYIGAGGDVVIPSMIDGNPVTELKAKAFWRNETIRKVTLPNTLTTITDGSFGAFQDSSVEEIVIPEGVKKIGHHAFDNTQLTHITLPSTATELGAYLIMNNKKLVSFEIKAPLTEIPSEMFAGCTAIETVNIPESVTKIGDSAFAGCTSLTQVTVPKNVKRIEDGAFHGCTALTSVDLPLGLENIVGNSFAGCTALKTIVIPTSVKRIGGVFGGTFANAGLENVIIPYGVEYLDRTFNSDVLRAVYVPSSVKDCDLGSFGKNAIAYVAEGSAAEKFCQIRKISYEIDNSVDTPINVLYNGKRVSFHKYGQNPVNDNGSTLVPLRPIFETMGASVDWDAGTRTATATRGGVTIKITIDSDTLYKNGEAVKLSAPAKMVNGHTMVPIRAVAESFGAQIGWNAVGAIVTITG